MSDDFISFGDLGKSGVALVLRRGLNFIVCTRIQCHGTFACVSHSASSGMKQRSASSAANGGESGSDRTDSSLVSSSSATGRVPKTMFTSFHPFRS